MNNENVPLLGNEQNGSASSSNGDDRPKTYPGRPKTYPGRRPFQKPKSYSFTERTGLERRKNHQNYSSIPAGSSAINEESEIWVRNQKEFISRSGKKASVRKRLAFQCDTSRGGRIWELFDAVL